MAYGSPVAAVAKAAVGCLMMAPGVAMAAAVKPCGLILPRSAAVLKAATKTQQQNMEISPNIFYICVICKTCLKTST